MIVCSRDVPWTFENQEKYMRCFSEEKFLEYIDKFGKNIFGSYFGGEERSYFNRFYTPLHFTLRYGYPIALQKLIELGAEIRKDHAQPLVVFACSYANDFGPTTPSGDKLRKMQKEKIEVLKLLLKHGADPKARDAEEKSALEYVFQGRPSQDFVIHYWHFIYLLITHGADPKMRFRDGERPDEQLSKYFKDDDLMKSCPLSASELKELKDTIYETTHQYTTEELQDLVSRIVKTLDGIVWCEQQLYHNPHHFQDHSKHHFPLSETRRSIASNKKLVIEYMQQLGEALNKCGRELKPIPYADKDKLNKILEYFTSGSFFAHELEKTAVVLDFFKKRLPSLIAKRDASAEIENLRPSSFFGKTKTRFSIPQRTEDVLTAEQQELKDKILSILAQGNGSLPPIEKNILEYLMGVGTLDDIRRILTKETARGLLTSVKIIDLAVAEYNRKKNSKITFARTSYELRTEILELCSPLMTSAEAYTHTLDSRKMKNRMFLRSPANWVAERGAMHAKIIANQLILAAGLSKRLNHYVPSVWAVRAPTAEGKTDAINNDPLFRQAIDENGEMSGALKADDGKYALKKKHPTDKDPFLVNNQVHAEGAALFDAYNEGLKNNATRASVLIEGRFSTIEELEAHVLQLARERDGEVLLLDIASFSLLPALHRILTRNPFGKDPCPPLLDIIKGYKESFTYRRKLLERVKNDPSIKYFKLYFNDENGKRHIVAEKRHEVFKVFSEDLLERSCKLPADEEIEQQLNQIITPASIQQAINRHDIPEPCRNWLARWNGVPLSKAIQMHAMGIPLQQALDQIKVDAIHGQLYGSVKLQPFTGNWLKDYPQIIEHLHSEHLLHIRGVDEDGRGLNWHTNKFAWGLNPKFNPETVVGNARRGGFQMKLGYFLIPVEHIDQVLSSSLSPKVLQEFEVRNAKGEVHAIRFFVHPEANTHFAALHDAKIPYVKPEQSEFMGTPTSSYRSWVIRRVVEKEADFAAQPETVPFIIKIGVAGSPTDTSRLLPKNVIERSIQAQISFDQMEKRDFNQGANGSDLLLFKENLGLSLKNISNYPPRLAQTVDSGIIVREFPHELLEGQCKILSFSALMSVERMKEANRGICALDGIGNGLESLPLIFDVMHAAIKKGLVKSPGRFIYTYLIHGYLKAIEAVVFKHRRTLLPHGQNLCLVLNADNTPRGFAYRDFEAISQGVEGDHIGSFSFYYRYHILVKLWNLLTQATTDLTPPPRGAPTQLGYQQKPFERNLNRYLFQKFENDAKVLKILHELSLIDVEYESLLECLDANYMYKMSQYFDIVKANILMPDGTLPAAESGSSNESLQQLHNRNLWKYRFP